MFGSVIYGQEAVACGLIDSIGDLSDALDYLHNEIGKAGTLMCACFLIHYMIK